MMKNKKILALLTLGMMLISLLVPFGAVFAAGTDVLSGMPGTNGAETVDINNKAFTYMTDGDIETYNSFGTTGSTKQRIIYTFNAPIPIDKLEVVLKSNTTTYNPTIELKREDGTRVGSLKSITGITANTKQTFTVDTAGYTGVKSITFTFGNSSSTLITDVYDIKAFSPITINHDELSSLVTSVNGNTSVLTFGIPSSNQYYTGSKIYRDGVLITTLNNLESSYQDTGLAWNTTYSYKVTALYSDGFETAGVNGSVVVGSQPVDPATVPPGPVVGLVASDLTAYGGKLTWSLPSDTDLDKVKIYKDDILIDTIAKTNTYTVSGLTPSMQYKISVSAVDIDGNESPKSDVIFTTLEGPDLAAPDVPTGLQVTKGDSALFVQWNEVKTADDLAGYNIYVDGVKYNTTLYKNNFISIPDLNNDQTYSIQVSSVDTNENESTLSTAKTGTPIAGAMPIVKTKYNLSDVAFGVSEWFKSYWLIIAFSAAIPLSFYIASRLKLMFIE